MAKPKYYKKMVEKSISASLAALEIYNKPSFSYKEETFAILMVNSWELLLKARIIKTSGVLKSIQIQDKIKTKSGSDPRRFYPKKNRTGQPMTISILSALDIAKVEKNIRANIEILIELRDNSVHFINEGYVFKKKTLEVATATMSNYAQYLRENFNEDIEGYEFSFTPISFINPTNIPAAVMSAAAIDWVKYVSEEEKRSRRRTSNYDVVLQIETKFKKSNAASSVGVFFSTGPDAVPVKIEEDDLFKNKYNIDYKTLVDRCKNRYSDFKQDKKFYDAKKKIEDNEQYSRSRYLDPTTKKTKKVFYTSDVFKYFDGIYNKE